MTPHLRRIAAEALPALAKYAKYPMSTKYFYVDTYEGPFRRRWELSDVAPASVPGFITGKRKDGKVVTVAVGRIETEQEGPKR